MPTATAARRKKSTAQVEVLEPAAVSAAIEEPASVPLFNPFDESIPFFMATAMIQDEEWHRYLIYLYRLLPKIRNPENERNFIGKYARVVDEADIKADHGGGKFQIYLTEKAEERSNQPGATVQSPPRSRNFIFSIAGAPKLQPGQATTSDAGNAPVSDEVQPAPGVALAPRPSGKSDVEVLASVLKDLIENRQNGNSGDAQSLDLLGQSYKTGLTIVSEAARHTVQSSTGSLLGDKLLERLLDSKLGGGGNGDSDLRDKLALIAIERLQNPPVVEGKDPLGQLSFVKDLMGVESITDLIRPGGNDTWKTKLVELGVHLVGNLPQLFQLFIANQQQQFQRELQLEALRRQGTVPLNPNLQPTSPRIEIETTARPPAPGPIPVPAPGEVPVSPLFNPAQMALEEIVVDFTQGLDGQMTARLVSTRYPTIIEQMKPMLGDLAQVKLFAQNTAPLNEIAGESEFPQFLTEFVDEILRPAGDEAEDHPDGTEVPEGA
jgi:hypothetical protein